MEFKTTKSDTLIPPDKTLPILTYEFHVDSTVFARVGSGLVDQSGKWSFNAEKQIINIQLRGMAVGSIGSAAPPVPTAGAKARSPAPAGRRCDR